MSPHTTSEAIASVRRVQAQGRISRSLRLGRQVHVHLGPRAAGGSQPTQHRLTEGRRAGRPEGALPGVWAAPHSALSRPLQVSQPPLAGLSATRRRALGLP